MINAYGLYYLFNNCVCVYASGDVVLRACDFRKSLREKRHSVCARNLFDSVPRFQSSRFSGQTSNREALFFVCLLKSRARESRNDFTMRTIDTLCGCCLLAVGVDKIDVRMHSTAHQITYTQFYKHFYTNSQRNGNTASGRHRHIDQRTAGHNSCARAQCVFLCVAAWRTC